MRARGYAAGGASVVGGVALGRLLVLTDQIGNSSLRVELLSAAQRKAETLRSSLQELIATSEDPFSVVELAELLADGELVDRSWADSTLQSLRERLSDAKTTLAESIHEKTARVKASAGEMRDKMKLKMSKNVR